MTSFRIQSMGLEVHKSSDFSDHEKIRLVPLFVDSNYVNGIPDIILERDREVWVSKVCPEILIKKHVIFAVVDSKEEGIGDCIWSIGAENYKHSDNMMVATIPSLPGCSLWASGKIEKS